jgi:hypothetical protein
LKVQFTAQRSQIQNAEYSAREGLISRNEGLVGEKGRLSSLEQYNAQIDRRRQEVQKVYVPPFTLSPIGY